jgi:hypothetical protein
MLAYWQPMKRNGELQMARTCDCGSNTRIYYANIELFGERGPGGAAFSTNEVEVEVCKNCGKSEFQIPEEIRQRFLRS